MFPKIIKCLWDVSASSFGVATAVVHVSEALGLATTTEKARLIATTSISTTTATISKDPIATSPGTKTADAETSNFKILPLKFFHTCRRHQPTIWPPDFEHLHRTHGPVTCVRKVIIGRHCFKDLFLFSE